MAKKFSSTGLSIRIVFTTVGNRHLRECMLLADTKRVCFVQTLQNLKLQRFRMERPLRSPDLNPVKHVWDMLGKSLCLLTNPLRNIYELRACLCCEWGANTLNHHS